MGFQWLERHLGSEEAALRLAQFGDRIYGMDSSTVMSGVEPSDGVAFFLRSYLDFPEAYRAFGIRLLAAFMGYLEDMEM